MKQNLFPMLEIEPEFFGCPVQRLDAMTTIPDPLVKHKLEILPEINFINTSCGYNNTAINGRHIQFQLLYIVWQAERCL